MDLQKVPLTHSIGVELLKKIFGVYCIAAIIISLFQGWMEYSQTRDRVILNMVEHQPLVEDGLANAVWHLDQPLLNSLIGGVVSQSVITGVSIYNEDGHVIAEEGQVEAGISVALQSAQKNFATLQNTTAYHHHFELFDPNGLSVTPIGLAVFYTGDGVVIDDVKSTLISLVAAAVIKTGILWVVFIYFGRKLLNRPLNSLIVTVRKLPLEIKNMSESRPKQAFNELELFEYALTNMVQKLERTLADLRSSNEKLSNINIHLQRAVEQSPTISTILSHDGEVIYTTPSFATLTGYACDEAQALFDSYFFKELPFKSMVKRFENNPSRTDIWTGEVKVLDKGGSPIFLAASISPVYSDEGQVDNFLFSANDISELKQLELDLKQKNTEQHKIISKLEDTQDQLLQSEKMASIGQLAAGVAHEINNPVGFINSNVSTLSTYLNDLFELINAYDKEAKALSVNLVAVQQLRQKIDFEYLREDIPSMLEETQEGLDRVKKIVRDLMGFSRTNETQMATYDLRKGLESTLNVAWHELKYKAEIIKEFDDIPEIECMPSQLNQVFMNLMVNAAQAIETQGTITLRTKCKDNQVIVEIEDSGSGIEAEHLNRLFDPFFTTKPVGEGTGLGLSVSYGIVKKHNGEIAVDSNPGEGTRFRICLPVRQPG